MSRDLTRIGSKPTDAALDRQNRELNEGSRPGERGFMNTVLGGARRTLVEVGNLILDTDVDPDANWVVLASVRFGSEGGVIDLDFSCNIEAPNTGTANILFVGYRYRRVGSPVQPWTYLGNFKGTDPPATPALGGGCFPMGPGGIKGMHMFFNWPEHFDTAADAEYDVHVVACHDVNSTVDTPVTDPVVSARGNVRKQRTT